MQPILIIASDLTLQVMHRVTLTAAGYRSTICDDGLAGLAQAWRDRHALILLDLRAPVVSGVTAVRVLRNSPATIEIPIVVMASDEHALRHLRYVPNVALVVKSFGQEDIVRLVAEHARPPAATPVRRYVYHA